MLQAMRGKGIETYATYTSDEEREALPKECVALRIPHFKSKFKYASTSVPLKWDELNN